MPLIQNCKFSIESYRGEKRVQIINNETDFTVISPDKFNFTVINFEYFRYKLLY